MSDNNKPASAPKAVPIKQLRFVNDEDIPGRGMENALAGRGPKAESGVAHDIEFQPWLRRFRIAWMENGKTEPTKVFYFPESRIRSYEEW